MVASSFTGSQARTPKKLQFKEAAPHAAPNPQKPAVLLALCRCCLSLAKRLFCFRRSAAQLLQYLPDPSARHGTCERICPQDKHSGSTGRTLLPLGFRLKFTGVDCSFTAVTVLTGGITPARIASWMVRTGVIFASRHCCRSFDRTCAQCLLNLFCNSLRADMATARIWLFVL